ncbi:minor capsid protein [Limosilactobacillus gorillae]|uniref:minor capsid protein n=1 Tax=Limosilactobacillus gorillae TaxID=1450649 RepID=UPI000B28CBE5|nr:minor capsid protein [Limosilactobacillus gorillae]
MTKKPPKSKQNEVYWQAREEAEKQYILNQLASDDEFNKILEARFNRTLSELEDKITADLARLSKNNKISYQEAQQAVRTADIKQLGAEAKTIVAKAHATGDPSLEAEVAARLRLYNATMRINRLEMIKAKIGQEMVGLGIDVNQDVLNKLTDDYQAEIRRQAGILSDSVASPNALRTKTALQHVYAQTNSATFSNRIWHNMDVLKAKLDMELSNVVLTGKNVQDVAREIRPLVNKNVTESRYVAERLARTESARIQNEAKIDSFKRNGYDYCRWHAEPKACVECANIARADNGWGQGVYKVSDVPYLPVHPNCRCSLSAYWVDNQAVSEDKTYLNATPSYVADHRMPVQSKPLSVIAKTANGKVIRYRLFDKNGNVKTDIDTTNHGNAKQHPIVPHSHRFTVEDGIITNRSKGRKLTQQEKDYIERWDEK